MQAIVTKYHGPTDRKPSRITARCDAGRIVVQWDHRLNVADNHREAVSALATKLGWSGTWILGSLPESFGGYCAVIKPE